MLRCMVMTGSQIELQQTKIKAWIKTAVLGTAYTHDWLNNTDPHILKCIVMTCNIGLICHWRKFIFYIFLDLRIIHSVHGIPLLHDICVLANGELRQVFLWSQ